MGRILLLLAFCYFHHAQAQSVKTLKVGIVLDHDAPELNQFADRVARECQSLLGGTYKIEFHRKYGKRTAQNPAEISKRIADLMADNSIDLIVGTGVIASDALSRLISYNKPVIATSILDPTLQKIPYTPDGASGVNNFTYVVSPTDFYRDLQVFHDIFPYENLTLFIDVFLLQRLDREDNTFRDFMKGLGAAFTVISVDQLAQESLAQMDSLTDAVYYGPLIGMAAGEIDKLITNVNRRKLPSFSFVGRLAVEKGVLAGQAPASNLDRMARRVALDIERYLDDGELADLKVELNYQEELTINMATARSIGFSPGWDFLREATLLHEEEQEISRTVHLLGAIEEALENNWTLAIADKSVSIGLKEIQQNRASLLPQLDVSASSSIIDQDRAAASGGQFPERTSTGSSSFSQIVYSEGAFANYQIAKRLQEAREQDRAATRLDVIQETVEAYLNLLITKTVERIQKENIRLNRVNLRLAEVRQEVGYAGPSDLYRWQTNIALANIDLNNAQANRRTAEINLNRILNRPLGELFKTVETDLLDSNLITNDPRLQDYVDNPEDLRKFTAFMVQEGLNQLPEIKAIDANIKAQERLVKLYRRNFYLPVIGVGGSADYLLNKGGAGSQDIQVAPGLQLPNDLSWQLGVSATLPLFSGGKRSADLQKSLIELEQLQYQKYDLLNQLEQRIRSTMEQVGASYSNIQLSQEAQRAATLNFKLVQEAYQQGTVSVITLIDAQNAAVQASLNEANAGYEFMIDLLNVDRAIGRYYSLSAGQERQAYFERLRTFTENFEQ